MQGLKSLSATCRSILRNCSISPKKLDLAARLVRRMHIDDALLQMKVKHKKAAKMVHEVTRLLLSATATDHTPSLLHCWLIVLLLSPSCRASMPHVAVTT